MERHRACVILNPAARAAAPDEVREIVGSGVEIWITRERGDGIAFARRAVSEGFDTVIAAGGDGTLNEVVNGLMPTPDGVVCGVLPLGTGNDFARTIGMAREPKEAWAAIQERRIRKVDVVALDRDRSERWFINMAVGGAIDEVHDKLSPDLKQRWGPFAYLRAGAEALSVLNEVGPHHVVIRLDGGAPLELDAWSVAVANGRTVGGGIPVAPLADVSDGLLDLVVVPGLRCVEMAKLAALVLLGKHLDAADDANGSAIFHRARTIEVRSEPAMPFTADGETNPGSESYFIAHRAALDMIVGPEEPAS